MKYEKSARINANANKVYQAVSDVQQLDRWLPKGLHKTLIEEDAGQFMVSEHTRPDQANKRITWNDGISYKGWVQINEAGQQAAEATIHVESDVENVSQADIDKFLVQALGSLEKQVASAGAPAAGRSRQ